MSRKKNFFSVKYLLYAGYIKRKKKGTRFIFYKEDSKGALMDDFCTFA